MTVALDLRKQWPALLEDLVQEFSGQNRSIAQMIRRLKLEKSNRDQVVIACPDANTRLFAQRHLKDHLSDVLGDDRQLSFSLMRKGQRKSLRPSLRIGSANRLVWLAMRALIESDDQSMPFPLLYIEGPEGSGKSCFLNYLESALESLNCVRVTGAGFNRALGRSIACRRAHAWRQMIREADIFLIDNVDQVAASPLAVSELEYTLESFHNRACPVVVTSRMSPSDAEAFGPRLRSQLLSGLQLPLALPSQDMITTLFLEAGLKCDQAIPAYLAEQNLNMGRLLEIMQRLPRDRAFSLTDLQALFVKRLSLAPDTHQRVLKMVAAHYQCDEQLVTSRRKGRQLSLVRRMVLGLLVQSLGLSPTDAGQFLGGRGRTTVLSSLRILNRELDEDEKLAATYSLLAQRIR